MHMVGTHGHWGHMVAWGWIDPGILIHMHRCNMPRQTHVQADVGHANSNSLTKSSIHF